MGSSSCESGGKKRKGEEVSKEDFGNEKIGKDEKGLLMLVKE